MCFPLVWQGQQQREEKHQTKERQMNSVRKTPESGFTKRLITAINLVLFHLSLGNQLVHLISLRFTTEQNIL